MVHYNCIPSDHQVIVTNLIFLHLNLFMRMDAIMPRPLLLAVRIWDGMEIVPSRNTACMFINNGRN